MSSSIAGSQDLIQIGYSLFMGLYLPYCKLFCYILHSLIGNVIKSITAIDLMYGRPVFGFGLKYRHGF